MGEPWGAADVRWSRAPLGTNFTWRVKSAAPAFSRTSSQQKRLQDTGWGLYLILNMHTCPQVTTLKKIYLWGVRGGCSLLHHHGAGKATFTWTTPPTPGESLQHFAEQGTLKRKNSLG